MARSTMTAPTLQLSLPQALPPVSRLIVALAQTVLAWELRRNGRHALKSLDAHLLKDIGLTPGAAEAECAKAFWQA
ncbi:DUF1127 domain-containing protein [Gemmobacter caeruleus]|uniref:DUF1127 domain-containing protein n=1 Tax=Gemmobacter caeruleus TaxID=2595004 RepID=UPI001EEFA590|nr:DUF1127 domain-containing protein [Gemmobacter caeruleus]